MPRQVPSLTLAAAAILALFGCSSPQAEVAGEVRGGQRHSQLIEDAEFEVQRGNFVEAVRLYDEAVELESSDPLPWVGIARLRYRTGEHFGALEAADHALGLDPDYPPALLLRAQIVRDAHGLKAALPWFERTLEIAPENVDLIAEYGATLGDLGRYEEMLVSVRKLAELDPKEPRVHYLQAVLAARAGDPVMAASLLKRSGMRDDGVPSAIVLGAIIDIRQGNFDTAAAELERLLERQPGNVGIQHLFARTLWLNGRDRELIDRFAVQAAGPDASPYLMMLVGRALERVGEREQAIALIEQARSSTGTSLVTLPAAETDHDALPVQTRQMRELLTSGDIASAQAYARRLVEQFPKSSDMKVLAGDAFLAGQEYESALVLYGQAAQIRRPWPLTKKIIFAFRQLGNDDAADTLIVRQVAAEPQNAEALSLLARRSAEDDDWLRVKVLLDTAIASGGLDFEASAMRARATERVAQMAD